MKEIHLKPQGVCLVDDEDYDFLSQHNWYLSTQGYAIGGEAKQGLKAFVKMHRVIMGITNPKIKVDHIFGNKLDNRKNKLRIVTPSQNRHNSKKRTNTINNYKGVFYVKESNLYQSRCRACGQDYFLGYYYSEIAAAYAYNKKAIELSSYSRINFLPHPVDYLEEILQSQRAKINEIKQSKYKYIYFKQKVARMKCDKWYIAFKINNKWFRKGYFFTEDDAVLFLKNNYSVILNDAGDTKF